MSIDTSRKLKNDYEYIGKHYKLTRNLVYWRKLLRNALDREDADVIAYASLQLSTRQQELEEFVKTYKAKIENKTLCGRKKVHVPDVLKVNEQYKVEPVSFIPAFD